MTRSYVYLWILFGIAGCIGGLTGCQTSAPIVVRPPAIDEPTDVADVRRAAWTEARSLIARLEAVKSRNASGVAAWVREFRRAEVAARKVRPGRVYELLDVQALITKNPVFWSAVAEVDPADPTMPLVHALLLTAAGEFARAQEILEMLDGAFLMPEALRDVLYLNRARVDLLLRYKTETATEPKSQVKPTLAERMATTSRMLEQSPHVPELLQAGIELQLESWKLFNDARLSLKTSPALAEALGKLAEPIAQLERVSPSRGALFSGDAERRLAARSWLALRYARVSVPRAMGVTDLRVMADAYGRMGRAEPALIAKRLMVGVRGSAEAKDFADSRPWLQTLVGGEASETILARWQRGPEKSVRIFTPERIEPLPAGRVVHPLFRMQLERAVHEATRFIESDSPSSETMILRYAQRADALFKLGRVAEAEADVNRGFAMGDSSEGSVSALASLRLAQGRPEDAARLIAESIQPSWRKIFRMRASVNYARGDRTAAAADFFSVADSDVWGPDTYLYAYLYALALSHLDGTPFTEAERARLEALSADTPVLFWSRKLASYLLGELNDDQLLSRAALGSEKTSAADRSDALYLIGMRALAAGDQAKAVNLFAECVGLGAVDMLSHAYATHELRRLAPERLPARAEAPTSPAVPAGSNRARV